MQGSLRWFAGSKHLITGAAAILIGLVLASGSKALPPSGYLEFHTINVQQGAAHLIVGPDGTTVLMEAGFDGKGVAEVVPYLQSIGLIPVDGLDYMIAGHQHSDHLGGLDEVITAGYDVRTAIYYNGSSYTTPSVTEFFAAAATTTAGPAIPMTVGTVIPLGDGARITCVAVDGHLIDGQVLPVTNENDRSIALLVEYGSFDYLWASDLGGGPDDGDCTGRGTTQINVETPLLQALLPGGGHPMLSAAGVDVWHVNHHGSESSTNHDVMNLARPEVAIISTGAGQDPTFQHPRSAVVESVLLASAACVTAPPVLVLQTEEGNPTGPKTSFEGYSVGDIVVTTDGVSGYWVDATGQVSQGPNERALAGLPISLPLDETAGPTPTATATPPPGSAPTPTLTLTPIPPPTATPTTSASGNLSDVVINEYLPDPQTDWDGGGALSSNGDEWIELHNPSSLPVDLSGAKLDDITGGGTSPYTIPAGSSLPAGGYRVFYGSTTGVALNNTGDTVQLVAPNGTTVIDTRSFGATVKDHSEGRNPDGAGTWTFFTGPAPGGGPGQPSPGGSNAGTATPTPTRTATPASAATNTPSATPTWTSTRTPTVTSTATATQMQTATASFTPTLTPTATAPPTATWTHTATATPTNTTTASWTHTATPTPTDTTMATVTETPSFTASATLTPTATWTQTATATPSDTATAIPSDTATATASWTHTTTPTETATATVTETPSFTASETPTPTWTATSTSTPSRTVTATPTSSATPTSTPASTPTATTTPTSTPSATPPTADHLLVSEVYYDAAGSDQSSEWVEIHNPTTAVVFLSSYKLGDETTAGGGEGMYLFPTGASAAPGARLVVAQKATAFRSRFGFRPNFEIQSSDPTVPNMIQYTSWSQGDLLLDNAGDEVLLLDATDSAVDVVTFEGGSYPGVVPHPGVATGHSIERSPASQDTNNCSVDFVDRAAPSPGS